MHDVHHTSSGVRIIHFPSGSIGVHFGTTERGALLLTATEWRELAMYAIAHHETCDAAPRAAS